MKTINIHEAKTHLSRLVDLAAAGEPFIIAKSGKPIAKVVPLSAKDSETVERVGFLAGKLLIPDDFDRMGEAEIETMFSGKP